MRRHGKRSKKGKRVVIVGLGNIGSEATPLIGRMPEVGSIDLIDWQDYDAGNVLTQNVLPSEVGKPKAIVQARKLKRIRTDLEVRAFCERVQDIPIGLFRADVVVACLDNLAGRQFLGQACFRMGTTWVDSGVDSANSLARVNVYAVSGDASCIECAWDAEYDSLEQTYPCGAGNGPAPTNAAAYLGSAAAAMQAAECAKLLSGNMDMLAVGKQITLDLAYHNLLVTTFSRNRSCRFDHVSWDVVDLECDLLSAPLGAVFDEMRTRSGSDEGISLSLEGHPFIKALMCSKCGHRRETLRLEGRMGDQDTTCACGEGLVAPGFDKLSSLAESYIPREAMTVTMKDVGFRAGDVLTVLRGSAQWHFQL